EDAEKQFSAVTVDLPGSVSYISYRGTDSSIVGWKEDFNMSFKCPVPSQESAVSYMNKAASVLTTDLIAGGHSKGGNLAVFAASFCRGDFKGRISSVYNFDGPGFDSKVIEQDGYKDICGRVLTFVPQSSIIGMLLEHEEPYTIIKSRGKNGLIQHNIYSWLVGPKGFTRLDNVDSKSTFIDHTLKEWVRKMTPQEREVFVDTSYKMICKTGAHTVNDLNGTGLKKVMVLLSSLKGMDDESKNVIFGAVELLLESAKNSFKKVFL
uniref:Mbeg1-like protein n=1 Tax=Candidatus Fimenecus sp. TaxID=3022888 RepID=UPI003FED6EF0